MVQLPPRYLEWQVAAGLPFPSLQTPGGKRGDTEPLGPPGDERTDRERPDGNASIPRLTDRPVRLTIVSPAVGARLLRDPEMPSESTTLSLRAIAEPAVPELVWYVDGRPWALERPPYSARWPVSPGVHTFQVGVPLTPLRSKPVTVRIE